MNDGKNKTPDEPEDVTEIRDNIERTRAQMSGTLEALQGKLNPTVLKERLKEGLSEAKEVVKSELAEAKEAVKVELVEAKDAFTHEVREQYQHARDVVHDATIGRVEDIAKSAGDTMKEAKITIVDTIRANPIPAALAGIGLAWLFMNRRTAPALHAGGIQQMPHRGSSDRGVMGYATRVQHVASDAMHEVGHKASDVASAARHEASSLADGAGQLVHQAQDQMGQLAQNARGTARRAEASLGSTFTENPLAMGAVALALGTAVGLALPKTRIEDDLLGETRDGLLERAGEMAHEMVGKAQEVAEQLVTGETEGGWHAEASKASGAGKAEAKPKTGTDDGAATGAPRTGEGARRALS